VPNGSKSFSVVVAGEPVGQGSMRHIGNGRLIAQNDKKLKAWRAAIVEAIQQQFLTDGEVTNFDGACRLVVRFCIGEPAKLKREYPTVPYDLDKLVRAVGDSCQDSGLVGNDSMFVNIDASKRYAEGCPFGAHILVESVTNSLHK
jgi:Holliday junction resolvase RusA-like endonuclease